MAMKVEQVLHMVGGAGETSYATNSRLQRKAIVRTKPIVEQAIKEVYDSLHGPQSLVVADLGCSSGPNTFAVISEIMDAVGGHCSQLRHPLPEMQFFLNDLPGNDFNTIFRYSTTYKQQVEQERGGVVAPYYVVGVPGSFYERLFLPHSVHFVHSSYCLMWLSQVPCGLESDISGPLNKGNIYLTSTSPPTVVKAYLEQFQRDFSTFLKLRSKELVFGGRMVLTFLGRKNSHTSNGELCHLWGLLADALNSLVKEGIVNEEKVNALNLPIYAASIEEVKAMIENEESLALDQVQIFESNWDPLDDSGDDFVLDNCVSGQNVAKCIRAVIEPMLVQHFGKTIMDDLFSRYAKNVSTHLLKGNCKYTIFVIALKKKE